MDSKRSYGDGCGVARALDLVGERWALLVVRELLLGPKRFTDLRAGLPNASSNVVTQRLGELEQFGVVRRRKLPPPAGSWVYELTEWGRDLEPIVLGLGRWGVRSPLLDPNSVISVDSMMLTLMTFFDPEASGDLNARYEVHFGETVWTVRVSEGRIDVFNGSERAPDITIETDPKTFVDLVGKGDRLAEAERKKEVKILGDPGLVVRLLNSIVIPEPASPESRI